MAGQHRPWRVAVVGSGIAGLAAARALQRTPGVRVTLFEREARFGGHAHTVDVTLPDAQGEPVTHGVDTGFLVFNHRTYPGLVALLSELGVPTAASDMSFSVQAPQGLDGRSGRLEWSGSTLGTVFAQRRNLVSPAFWGLLGQILRFNRVATALAAGGHDAALQEPLADFLQRHRFGQAFQQGYLLPMLGCIWSCPLQQMLRFPVATLVRFCHNHGLLQVRNRPVWHTVRGGSRQYVRAVVSGLADARAACPVLGLQRSEAGVRLLLATGAEAFDAVVLACHAGQALALLGRGASAGERAVLGPLRTQRNLAVLHTDTQLLPQSRRAWAAWNYERGPGHAAQAPVCLHYLINRLQPLPFAQPVLVSLNPVRAPREAMVLAQQEVWHPVMDLPAAAAQRALGGLQGLHRTWWAGAWTGHGFHEDGLQSGLRAAAAVLQALRGAAPQLALAA